MWKYFLICLVGSLGALAQVPKEEATSFVHVWVALEGKIATAHPPLPDNQAIEEATESHNDKLAEFLRSWRQSVLAPFSKRVNVLSTEVKESYSGLFSLIDRPEPDESVRSFNGIALSSLLTVVGYQFVSWQRIALNISRETPISLSNNQVISGEPQTFYAAATQTHRDTDVSWTVEQIKEVFEKAQETYWKKCDAWKAKVATQFGEAFVYASCGIPTSKIEYVLPSYTKRNLTYSSNTGTIYYIP